jgi:hypothetical protein
MAQVSGSTDIATVDHAPITRMRTFLDPPDQRLSAIA